MHERVLNPHPRNHPGVFDYTQKPFLVIWETTRACDLACVHCRASAEPDPAPDELSTMEAMRLIQQVKEMGTPIFVFSGGDPLKRKDLPDLIRYAKFQKLRT
ncbi:radical SAM protein, partial [Omnitrophica bacterium]|nr:radical SAM protein [Candidatus Omnitrophota bacterium]